MRYPQCNDLCDGEHDVHYLGRLIKGVSVRDSAKDLDEFLPYASRKCCGCGGIGRPHIGFSYSCSASNSGSHYFDKKTAEINA